MRKKYPALLIIVLMIITAVPRFSYAAGSLPSPDDSVVLNTPSSDYRGGDCVLTACKTMIRRAAIMKGSSTWSKFTNTLFRGVATTGNNSVVRNSFTIKGGGFTYNVGCCYLKSTTASGKTKEIAAMLANHPEGIVVWGSGAASTGDHGVLIVEVRDGVVYAVDPAHNVGSLKKGIQAWNKTTMLGIARCSKVWYIKSITGSNAQASPAAAAANTSAESTLSLWGVTSPSSVKKGSGFTIRGNIESNYRITDVEVAVIGGDGKAVITAEASPGTYSYDVYSLDQKVKFGTLAAGSYKYRITAADEKKSAVLHEASFTVVQPEPAQTSGGTNGTASSGTQTSASSASASTLKQTGATLPSSINKGSGFTIRGVISSNTNISVVNLVILDADGKAVIFKSASPNKKSYDLRNMDSSVKFGTLPAGKYIYRVTARDKNQTLTLIRTGFFVREPAAAGSSLKIKSFTAPKSIKKGNGFTIRGTVSSNYNIKSKIL